MEFNDQAQEDLQILQPTTQNQVVRKLRSIKDSPSRVRTHLHPVNINGEDLFTFSTRDIRVLIRYDSDTFSVLRVMPRRAASTDDLLQELSKVAEQTEKSLEEVRKAVSVQLENFNDPEQYGQDNFDSEAAVKESAISAGKEFLERLQKTEDQKLQSYQERISAGLDGIAEEDYFKPIFIFISVQDGLMDWICQERRIPYDQGSYYYSSTKRKELKEAYEDLWGVSGSKLKNNLDDFYDH